MTAGCCGRSRAAHATTSAIRCRLRPFSSTGPTLRRGDVQEEAVWIAGPQILERARRVEQTRLSAPMLSHTLSESGFVVLSRRSGQPRDVRRRPTRLSGWGRTLTLLRCRSRWRSMDNLCSSIPERPPTRWMHALRDCSAARQPQHGRHQRPGAGNSTRPISLARRAISAATRFTIERGVRPGPRHRTTHTCPIRHRRTRGENGQRRVVDRRRDSGRGACHRERHWHFDPGLEAAQRRARAIACRS